MVVKRQIRHFKRMNLKDVEILLMDDGSDPPLKSVYAPRSPIHIYPTGDTRPWSQACARNLGAKLATGEYLLMTDIDHILTKELIESAKNFAGSRLVWRRQYGVLNTRSILTQDIPTLRRYGMDMKHYKKHGLRVNMHTNSFCIRADIFKKLGGYPGFVCNRPLAGNKGDKYFYQRFHKGYKVGMYKWQTLDTNNFIYTYPGLPEDPLGIFHNLKRGNLKNAVQANNAMAA